MNKVVYNACDGGFCISLKAVKWLAENGRDEIKAIAEEYLRQSPYGTLFNCYEIQRHDPDLVRCVETLGYMAGARFSNLKVRELKGNRYRIDEYDGYEEVYEPEDEEYTTIE